MTIYIRTVVNLPGIEGEFDYHLPAEFEGQVQPGCLVAVPFRQQIVQAVVTHLLTDPAVVETRPILAVLDSRPVLTGAQLELARQMTEDTLAPLSSVIDLMLPPGVNQMADIEYRVEPVPPAEKHALTPLQESLLLRLQDNGPLRGRQLDVAFAHKNWKAAATSLVRRGYISTRPVLLPPSVRPRTVRTVELRATPEEVTEKWDSLGSKGALIRRQAVLNFLLKEPWQVEASWVYANSGANLTDLQRLADMDLIHLGETEVWRDPLEQLDTITSTSPLPLTTRQREALDLLTPALKAAARREKSLPNLLVGVTGSGKTELYLQVVEKTLAAGRQALVLVPEIALTPQTVRRFAARFPGQVGLVHSRLTPGERYDTWRRARQGMLSVIIGPRSALFTPLPDPGLIILDECHDDSYHQTEAQPYYSTVDAACQYARLNHSALILGSATPPVNLQYQAQMMHWPVIRLPERVNPADGSELPLPPVQVVDMRRELKANNRTIFSRALRLALQETLNAGEQAILLLNRRGSASYVFCRDCGTSVNCPRCDLPLTYHAGSDRLHCHICRYERQMPKRCPNCSSSQIKQFGAGTETVEAELNRSFPEARVLRYDAETTQTRGAHDILLGHFMRGQADILVGTQMLAKGLDLPRVTLVGVVLAEVGLNFPDYRAPERVFQLLTQVAGRAGRTALGGKVIFQTFVPELYPIQYAARHDLDGFTARELEKRRTTAYPPYCRMVRLEIRSPQNRTAEERIVHLAGQIQHWIDLTGAGDTRIIGPAPCYFGKMNGEYRWHIILCGVDPAQLLRGRDLREVRIEVNPPSLL